MAEAELASEPPEEEPKVTVNIPWWQQGRTLGAGDVVEKVTRAVGIKPCGKCRRRKARLNRLLSFGGSSS